jgi:hypothetical protein
MPKPDMNKPAIARALGLNYVPAADAALNLPIDDILRRFEILAQRGPADSASEVSALLGGARCTSGSEAPRSMACEPCAWRSQCGDTASLMPAFLAVRLTMPLTARSGQVAAFAAREDGIIGNGVAAQGQERPTNDVRAGVPGAPLPPLPRIDSCTRSSRGQHVGPRSGRPFRRGAGLQHRSPPAARGPDLIGRPDHGPTSTSDMIWQRADKTECLN